MGNRVHRTGYGLQVSTGADYQQDSTVKFQIYRSFSDRRSAEAAEARPASVPWLAQWRCTGRKRERDRPIGSSKGGPHSPLA